MIRCIRCGDTGWCDEPGKERLQPCPECDLGKAARARGETTALPAIGLVSRDARYVVWGCILMWPTGNT